MPIVAGDELVAASSIATAPSSHASTDADRAGIERLVTAFSESVRLPAHLRTLISTHAKFASAITPIVTNADSKPKRAATVPPSSGPANMPRNVALDVMP